MPEKQQSVYFQRRKSVIMNLHKIDYNILYLMQNKTFSKFTQ